MGAGSLGEPQRYLENIVGSMVSGEKVLIVQIKYTRVSVLFRDFLKVSELVYGNNFNSDDTNFQIIMAIGLVQVVGIIVFIRKFR